MNESPFAPAISLRDIVAILLRRWPWVAGTFVLVVAGTWLGTARLKPVFEAQARVLLDTPAATGTPNSLMDLLSGSKSGGSLDLEIEKMHAFDFVQDVAATGAVAGLPEEIAGRLSMKSVQGQILEIAARAKTKAEAKDLANAVARVYIDRLRREIDRKSDQTQSRLTTAERSVRLEREKAARALEAFASEIGVSDPAVFFRERAARTVAARGAVEDARREQTLLEAKMEGLRAQLRTLKPELVAGYSLDKNRLIDSLQSEIELKKAERKVKLEDFLPGSDEIQLIDAEIQSKQTTLANARRDPYSVGSKSVTRNPDFVNTWTRLYDTQLNVRTARKTLAEAQAQLARLQQEQRRLTDRQYRYESLRRAYEIASEQYVRMRQGQSEARIKQLMAEPDARIFDPARLSAVRQISPRPLFNLAMALFLGLILGIALAFLAEYWAIPAGSSGAIPGLPHIDGVPVLGALPRGAGRDAALTPVAEDALREIGFGLLQESAGVRAPVALLAGTRSDPVTASVAAQLADVLGRDGLRVTLVDADPARRLADEVRGTTRMVVLPQDPAAMSEATLQGILEPLTRGQDADLVIVVAPSVWNRRAVGALERTVGSLVLVAGPDVPVEQSIARTRRLLANGHLPQLRGVVCIEPDALPAPAEVSS